MEFTQDQIVIILGILLGISELIALNPKWKSNSILQLFINSLKRVLSRKEDKPEKKVEEIVKDMALEEAMEAIKKEIEKSKK